MNAKTTRAVAVALALWFLVALVLGASGVFARVPFPLPAFVPILSIVLALLIFLVKPLHAWVMKVDLRVLVGLHVTRFVGVLFLMLAASGDLPRDFAQKAGYGDIAVAIFALLIVLLCIPIKSGAHKAAVYVWNFLGLVDILLVVLGAADFAMQNPATIAPFMKLPMSLLPTFLVPLIIVSHFVIFARLRRAG
jgi:hypothetical protein